MKKDQLVSEIISIASESYPDKLVRLAPKPNENPPSGLYELHVRVKSPKTLAEDHWQLICKGYLPDILKVLGGSVQCLT